MSKNFSNEELDLHFERYDYRFRHDPNWKNIKNQLTELNENGHLPKTAIKLINNSLLAVRYGLKLK